MTLYLISVLIIFALIIAIFALTGLYMYLLVKKDEQNRDISKESLASIFKHRQN